MIRGITMCQILHRIDNEKGTITIYLVIIFMAMLLLIGAMIDLSRIKIAENQLRRVANTAARSVMADYNTAMRNQYGLFAVNTFNYEENFFRYAEVNLSFPKGRGFVLLDFQSEDRGLVLMDPLGDTKVLKGQILEDMKYRAPIELTLNLIDKFRPLGRLAEFSREQNEMRQRAKNINHKLREISQINSQINQNKGELRNLRLRLKVIDEEIEELENKRPQSSYDLDRLEFLRGERVRIVNEMHRLKDATTELVKKCQDLINQVERELAALVPDAAGEADSPERKADPEPGHMPEIDQRINLIGEGIRNGYVTPTQAGVIRIKADIEKSLQALPNLVGEGGHLDEHLLAHINIDSVEEVLRELADEQGRVNVDEGLRDSLRGEERDLRQRFTDNEKFSGERVELADINTRVDPFENDENDRIAEGHADFLDSIFNIIDVEQNLLDLRDEIFINEFVLTRFSNLAGSSKGNDEYLYKNTEAEYILNGDRPKSKTIATLYSTRFALDTMAYLAFSKTAPPTFMARLVYALVLGAIQAAIDTYKLLDGQDVAVAEMSPAADNPLKDLRLKYTDHLRLFFLLNSFSGKNEQQKLERIQYLIKERSGTDLGAAYTMTRGYIETSIKLWFLPLTGIENMQKGPFGTEIKDGQCYIRKEVEFSY